MGKQAAKPEDVLSKMQDLASSLSNEAAQFSVEA
jgi:hypothetical protein